MKVNMKVTPGSLDGATSAKPSKPADKAEFATDTFTMTNKLDNALASVPDVRPEAVARAKALISDSSYPSAGTVKQLANFLAVKFNSVET